ncbi:hypothetical protein QWJ34_06205 [Saccharibacillus sp. CPCC 101409]|uniref:hypothetical protein n=1 Tax=Saccharibacillus sp. CPCC 101409 TaxID=3058041 RepID=UPI002672E0D3|nr:hypothetical protein [Saccharibacillus sp. CPCC 101409]MDO3409348.1 hypothetical protein [Saccharibacillus sp. CPCC 101409]
MDFRLVGYKKHISIDNVPILACPGCEHEEVMFGVRKDLQALLLSLPLEEEPYGLDYTDFNELACIAYTAFTCSEADTKDALRAEILENCEARINTLLDFYSFAREAGDQERMAEIEQRLAQLSAVACESGAARRYSPV